jgi:hydrogenase expression/formation protein HypE
MQMKRRSRLPKKIRDGRVDMTHGAGGKAMADLIASLFVETFDNEWLSQGNDFASVDLPPGRPVMTTDSFVVSPLFFPGGDIGKLAVCGTVNDLAVAGAEPLYLTVGFILEEGFPLAELARVVASMADAAEEAGVAIVTGDTKVVERGKGDGLFINTSGLGVVPHWVKAAPSGDGARVGDHVLVNGTMGDHGICILSTREGLRFDSDVQSDCAPLNGLVVDMLRAAPSLHTLRDPTRGGLATTLNEIAHQSNVGIRLREDDIPVRPQVAAACELLGIDPLYAANEGKLIVICPPDESDALLAAMREHPFGVDAAVVGEVVEEGAAYLEIETGFGGRRILDWLSGEQLPRIC